MQDLSWQHHRARIGYLSRFTPDDHEAIGAERAALRVAKIADDVRRAVADLPDDQRTGLAVALLGVVLPAAGPR